MKVFKIKWFIFKIMKFNIWYRHRLWIKTDTHTKKKLKCYVKQMEMYHFFFTNYHSYIVILLILHSWHVCLQYIFVEKLTPKEEVIASSGERQWYDVFNLLAYNYFAIIFKFSHLLVKIMHLKSLRGNFGLYRCIKK